MDRVAARGLLGPVLLGKLRGHLGPPRAADLYVLTARARTFWEACAATGAEMVPIAMTGWDRRPRIEHPVPWEKNQKPGEGIEKFYRMPEAAELVGHIEEAMQWTAARKQKCPAQTVIVYAWYEHDEGGWLCPTRKEDGTPDTSRLDAVGAMIRRWKP